MKRVLAKEQQPAMLPPNLDWKRSPPKLDAAAGLVWIDGSVLVDLEAYYRHNKLLPAVPVRGRSP